MPCRARSTIVSFLCPCPTKPCRVVPCQANFRAVPVLCPPTSVPRASPRAY
ncbi:hypothetical protein RHMOL_Rhmol02G0206300 [Rhododendron molle]|uniref:Uncharacterized protein n=1 Tax=Rhododendron molle TaxID=49168 RepID=A0ACC0PUQ2_RHOML|nr:hypothetical protein RHMOL_Rhmol02G0206300 [Rhododendron molle]